MIETEKQNFLWKETKTEIRTNGKHHRGGEKHHRGGEH